MARPKIPRKSTNIDMTAMCDVAFLLLSFFILTTKFKPAEAIAVVTPSSVAAKVAPDKDFVL
ncbi:biopolymer transporter ExbD, partial [Ochrobactrum soli]|nr:biopolymer transporter ExbD [[Ochrobactrum] soli]